MGIRGKENRGKDKGEIESRRNENIGKKNE